MRLKISDILLQGLDLRAETASDPWFLEIVQEAYGSYFPPKNQATLALHFLKTCDNVGVTGKAEVDIEADCARCLEPCPRHLSIPIELFLAPQVEKSADPKEVGLTEEDLNFAFYQGDSIDVGEFVHEYLVLALPIRFLCKEDCRGICPRCGKNLNEGNCRCVSTSHENPFSVLKKIQLFLIASLFLLSAAGAEEKNWSKTGEPLSLPPAPRSGFYLATGPALSGFVNEIRRPAGGWGIRGGYGVSDFLLIGLKGDWTLTRQFDVLFNFFDLGPTLSYFLDENLYLIGGGGVTWARAGLGTRVDGFDQRNAVTRTGSFGSAGVGYEILLPGRWAVDFETSSLYRRIHQGDFFEITIQALFAYRF